MVQLLRDHYGVDERWRFTDLRGRVAATPAPVLRNPDAAAAAIDAAAHPGRRGGGRARARALLLQAGHLLHRARAVGAGLGRNRRGHGPGARRRLRVPLDMPSVFQGVTRNRTVFVGRLGPEGANREFLEAIGKKAGTTAALFPIAVRGRVVNLLWGDSGAAGAARGDLGQLMAHMQKIPRAYLRIIRARIAETPGARPESRRADGRPAQQEKKSE